jgi:class 3 adenylate cyclase/tetratricopeptide (TPR) repeat protein
MTFEEIVDQAIEMVRRRGQVSYRMLKRQFALDDAGFEDLKDEILYSQSQIVDDEGRGFAWTGDTAPEAPVPPASVPTSVPGADQQPLPISYTPPYLTEKILTSRSALEGERKQVTVLFADIKDSTELIRDLDPEDAQKLLDPAIHIMMEAVHRFEGTVNQVLGDGIMSIFGAPIAHEDHAARACYAALAMQSAMRDYTEEVRRKQGLELRIRVGLNSGEVVVRTIGNDLHMDYSAVGPTTHLAARMEQLASPGSIRLSSSTLRLVEGLVQVNDLGPIPIKGMDESVDVYELTGASSIRRRLQATIARGLTKFVGRDTEIDALNQALEQSGSGHGQIVAAVGEAGVGKSRLVYEFVHSHRTQGWLVLESASVSYGKATPYFPVIDLLKRYVHVEDGDDPRTIRAKVTGQILTLDASLQETIPALLSLLDALPEDSPFLQLDPPQRRQRTLDGIKRIVLRESQVQPLLLVFEDLHWIDSETQALLDSLVESLSTAQLLLLVNYRPEYTHNWGSKTYYTQLRLDPLPPESADVLLDALLGNDASLESLKMLLIERTEGNPFFLEESVRTLVEIHVLTGKSGAYRLAQELPTIQVPATVQAVLAARIDRLSEDAKRLLQTASVIGNEVPFALLQAITEIPDEALHPGLTHLQAAEFLYETNLFPERIYTFKHALTHEVAYNSLLQERRRVLHAHIVEALETLSGDRLSEQVERLAYHALRGEVWDKALKYFRQAGDKAMEQSAYQNAVDRFEQALDALRHLPDSPDTVAQGIDVRLNMHTALLQLAEFERELNLLREAETLTKALGDKNRLVQIYDALTLIFRNLINYERALEYSQRTYALARDLGDFDSQIRATLRLGQIYYDLGDYSEAIECFQENIALLQGGGLEERLYLVRCLTELGDFSEGLNFGEEALRMAEEVDRPNERAAAYARIGFLHLRQGDLLKAIALLERGLTLSQAADLRMYFRVTREYLVLAYALASRTAEALSLLDQTSLGEGSMAIPMPNRGEAYLLSGCIKEAHQSALRNLERCQTHQARGPQAWALRLLGEISMHRDPPEIETGETHYQQALALANDLGMRPLQAHCHRGLGTLYNQTGQAEQARTELSTAIKMYRDMEMTFWLPETEAALAAVEGR